MGGTIIVQYDWCSDNGCGVVGTANVDTKLRRLPSEGWAIMAEAIAKKHARKYHRYILEVRVIDPD